MGILTGTRAGARWLAVFLASATVQVVGCGSEDPDSVASGRTGGGGSTGGGSSATPDSGGGTQGGGIFLDAGLGGDQGLTADSACAGETQQAERIVVAMYIMLDASGSMNTGSPRRWDQATQALTLFSNDPMSTGLKVAIQSFNGDGPCDGSIYNTPAVTMGELPGNAPNITTWLGSVPPNGATPTQGALLGLTSFTGTYAAATPGEKTVGLLVTDGLPTRCDGSGSTLSGIAQSAQNAGVLIFTMGMSGADFGLLDQIASAGGTGSAFDASAGPDAFLQALEAIRGIALQCEYSMPESTTGEVVDRSKINVEFTPSGLVDGGGTTPQPVGKVDSEAACAGVPWGWYYDDDMNPTKILLCPQTCDTARQDPQGKVSIILGCSSLPPV